MRESVQPLGDKATGPDIVVHRADVTTSGFDLDIDDLDAPAILSAAGPLDTTSLVTDAQLRAEVVRLAAQNDTLRAVTARQAEVLASAKGKILGLQEALETLTALPQAYGTFVRDNTDGSFDVRSGGKLMRVEAPVSLEVAPGEAWAWREGDEVTFSAETGQIVSARRPEATNGEVVKFTAYLNDGSGRVLVTTRMDEAQVLDLHGDWDDVPHRFREGDKLLLDGATGKLIDLVPKHETEALLLERVPNITWDQIGGLDDQISQIHDELELPFLYPEKYAAMNDRPTKGILLYGPPGCGKTLTAKAIAADIARKVSARDGIERNAYFINIKGPELLNKYVGETERALREVFTRAGEQASEGNPVIIFFDEIDSLFRARGSGISSDVESTTVPQMLALMDGVEEIPNVIIIGATNREDRLDPALQRPGRLDIKIKVGRPDRAGAGDIFSKYITPDLPIAPSELARHGGDTDKAIAALIDGAVTELWDAPEGNVIEDKKREHPNALLQVIYEKGDREILFLRDLASGAMIENIVRRAKRFAIKRDIEGGEAGLSAQDIAAAVRKECLETGDLPNTTAPDDFSSLMGKKGQRIVRVDNIAQEREAKAAAPVDAFGGRAVVTTFDRPGQYL